MVGVDATRYMMLSRSSDQMIDFDIEVARKQDASNPVYYVQYAHARICSILRKAAAEADAAAAEAGEISMDELAAKLIPTDADLSALTHESELALLRKMDDFASLIALAARDRAPFRLTHYAQDLAALFHQFYTNCQVPTLRCLSVGGEKLVPVAPIEGAPVLYNAYGPSECTIFTTTHEVDRLYERIPIGSPLANVRLYVVDKSMRRLPPLVPGELLIVGRGVGRGYLNRPDLSEKAFIQNPFCTEEGYERAYRTGDTARLLQDGNYDILGRSDGQVKVRGFRIELSEVEAVIRDFPGIYDATVQAFEDEHTGEKFIAAYVVSEKKSTPPCSAASSVNASPPSWCHR
jgi:acyl-CoA synthetase (AMP-forming)/AMP-acid ligase II